ncbi:MAG: FG-GAP repeat protein, partial [Phycisphaerales bacterium]
MMETGRVRREFGLIGLIIMSCSAAAHGVELLGCEIDKIIASDADELDGFGEHLSVRGDVAIVGAWNDEDTGGPLGGFAFGSAYVLKSIDGVWTEEQKLLPSDPESEKRFGHDVAVDGDALIVGAVGANAYTGAVYFYTRIGGVWTNEQKIQPESATFIDEVGFAVAIDGDVAVAGAPGDDEGCGPGCNSGAAYIFRNVGGTWVEEQKLIA